MRSRLALTILFMLVTGSVLAQDVNTEKGKLSYSVGWDIGSDIKRRTTEFDVESLITAIRDIVAGNDPKVAPEEMRTLLTALQEKVRAEQVEQFRQLSEENQVKSEEFLQANNPRPASLRFQVVFNTALLRKVMVHVLDWIAR